MSASKKIIPLGVRNIGDSCHMNAILTSLATSESFRLYVRVVAVTCGGFAAVLNTVLRKMDGDQIGKSMVEPYDLASALRLAGYSSARSNIKRTRYNVVRREHMSTGLSPCFVPPAIG